MSHSSTTMVRMVGIAVAALVAGGLTACSSDTDGDEGGDSGDSAAVVTEATSNLDQYYSNHDISVEMPAVPASATLAGKKVMYLSAGLSSPDGTEGLAAFKEAQEGLDFDLVVFDGQFTLTKYQEGIRQAVAQDVDAIILYGVDCAGNESALREARAASILIVGIASVDCNQLDANTDSLFDASVQYPTLDGEAHEGMDRYADYGAVQADYLISRLDGEVKVIQFDLTELGVIAALGDRFRERMAECSTCEIVSTVEVRVSDFGSGLQQKAEQELLKHPDANAIQVAYDDLMTLGVEGAIQSSGRKSELTIVAGNGVEATMEMIRADDGLNAGYTQSYGWDHFAGLDTAIRLLAGQEEIVAGAPLVIYDKDHNTPAEGAYEPGTDYRTAFRSAWGITP